MKTALVLSVISILMIACGQSSTPEPTNEPSRAEPIIQPSPTKPPTVVTEESSPTESPATNQDRGKKRIVPSPELIPLKKFGDRQKSEISQSDDRVAVSIYLSVDGQEGNVVAFIKNNGGDPRNIGTGYIEAYIPMRLLAELSEQPGVARVQKIIPPEPN